VQLDAAGHPAQLARLGDDAVARLEGHLEHRHRAFLAATSDAENTRPLTDTAGLTTHIAHLAGADVALYYASSADEKHFLPQPPGIGLERLHPQPVARGAKGAGRLLSAIHSSTEYVASDQSGLAELFNFVPDEVHVASLMAVPMHFGEHIGGFILLGNALVPLNRGGMRPDIIYTTGLELDF